MKCLTPAFLCITAFPEHIGGVQNFGSSDLGKIHLPTFLTLSLVVLAALLSTAYNNNPKYFASLLNAFTVIVINSHGSYFPLEEEEVTAYLLDLIGGATKSIPAGQHGETTPFISVVVHALAIPSLGHGSVHNFIASKQAGPSPAEFAFINMSLKMMNNIK